VDRRAIPLLNSMLLLVSMYIDILLRGKIIYYADRFQQSA